MPKIAIVLTHGYADWECAFLNGIGTYYGVETVNVAPASTNIRPQGGIQTIPDGSIESIKADAFDALVLCGGNAWTTAEAPDVENLVLSFLDQQKTVAAICGGTVALANAGILNDKRHTSNSSDFLTSHSDTYAGQSCYVDEIGAIADQNVITAAGNAPVHFSAAVFRAVGIDNNTVDEFLSMLAKEHLESSLSGHHVI